MNHELPQVCEFLFLSLLDYVTELIIDKQNLSLFTLQNGHCLIYWLGSFSSV
ncbi:uncharacterized protein METZ01_LOCUS255636 [marine metagenome]|uniref:Uncharacterized protein n=1 Tax=marine metagenome TaxID=408172 RepID=A0A382IU91_9ZZZZ